MLEATAGGAGNGRLHWRYEGTWHAVLSSTHADVGALLDWLDADRQRCVSDPALALQYDGKKDLKSPPDVFRMFLETLTTEMTVANRRSVDWVSAFATDVAVDNKGNTKPTALHFTAGQQQFLQMALELANHVTKEDLREAIVGPWRYQRPLPVMGWDATSARDYALRASNPSLDKKLGVPGADWLALRGLVFFPTVPRGNRILTTACAGGWKDGEFCWPLWTVPLTAPVVRSVLRQPIVSMAPAERTARGIGAVFSSGIRRSDQGGYGSLEPASVR